MRLLISIFCSFVFYFGDLVVVVCHDIGVDYYFRYRYFRFQLCICQGKSSPTAATKHELPDSAFYPYQLINWEDDIIYDPQLSASKINASAKMNSAYAAWIPSQHCRTMAAFQVHCCDAHLMAQHDHWSLFHSNKFSMFCPFINFLGGKEIQLSLPSLPKAGSNGHSTLGVVLHGNWWGHG